MKESLNNPQKNFTDLQEIMLHFKLRLQTKEGEKPTLTYCQLKISRQAILLLADSRGRIPANFMEALRYI